MHSLKDNNDSSSSSSSDSSSDDDLDSKLKTNPYLNNNNNHNNSNNKNNNTTSSKSLPPKSSNNRKRKLSNNTTNNANSDDSAANGPPKKRQRTSNLTINTHIENEDETSNNAMDNSNRSRGSSKDGKRRKKKKSDKDKSKKKKRKKALTPPKKLIDGVKIEHLECIVCKELPPNKIFQCTNSHLMCADCYGRIKQGRQCLCPECRVRMSRREPSRNKLAENYLKAHLFPCENESAGCKEQIQFVYLKEHCLNECKYRNVECKYAMLGCTWNGLAKDQKSHRSKCPIKTKSPKEILALVQKLNVEKERKCKLKMENTQKYLNVSKLIECRARNVLCRDVRIRPWNENTKTTEILNSNYFNAIHHRWQLQLKVEKVPNPKLNGNKNHNNSNTSSTTVDSVLNPELNRLYVRIQALSTIRKRIPLEIAILKGPDFGYKLEPIQFECEMTKNVRDSKWIDFVPNNILFNDEEMKAKFFTNYQTENKINLRVMLVDKRANGNSISFGGMNENFEDPIDDFGIELSDPEVNDNGSNRNHNHNNSRNRNGRFSSPSTTESSSMSRASERSRSDAEDSEDDEDMYSDIDDYTDTDDGYY